MQIKTNAAATTRDAKELVLSFINALNDENFDAARSCVADTLVFQGVMGTRNDAETYMNDMKKMKLKYAVQKVFVDGNDVCLWYDITMSGKEILSSGWYKTEEGKIVSFKVLFDPRPLLEQARQ